MKWMQLAQAKYQKGASAIEYALIAGLLAAILVVAVGAMGDGFGDTFDNIVACMKGEACPYGEST